MSDAENSNSELIPVEEARDQTVRKNVREINDLRDQLKSIERGIEQKIGKVEEKIEDSSTKAVEVLAIFVALFTFVSVEFQALLLSDSITAVAGTSLIMLGALMIFVILVDILLSNDFPITKTETGTGLLEPAIRVAKQFRGYYKEKVPLRLSSPNTWGIGLQIRVGLITLGIVFVGSGVALLAMLSAPSGDQQSKQQPDVLEPIEKPTSQPTIVPTATLITPQKNDQVQ